MIHEDLQKIGFTGNESRIIAALNAESNSGNYPSVIAKSTGLNRYTTYDVLERLYHQGVVLKLNKNRKLWYQIRTPDDIRVWLNEKQRKLQHQIETAETFVIPELLRRHKASAHKPSIQLLEGRKGIFNLAKETLNLEHEEILYLSSAQTVLESFSIKTLLHHVSQKKKKEIFSKLIFPKNEQENARQYIKQFYLGTGNTFFECRLFDFKTISNELMILPGSVVITNINSPHPFVVHIKSKEVYESYCELYQGIWKKSKPLTFDLK